MSSVDIGFWTRIAATSVLVNVPLAICLVVYGMPVAVAFALSAAGGVAALAIWDGSRSGTRETEAEPLRGDARAQGSLTSSPLSARSPEGACESRNPTIVSAASG